MSNKIVALLLIMGAAAYFKGDALLRFWRQTDAPALPALSSRATPPPSAPSPTASAPSSPTRERRYAPTGTFYLLKRKTTKSADGVIGIDPGTQVKLIRRPAEGKMVVSYEKVQFLVSTTEVTDDEEAAAHAKTQPR